MTEFNATMAYVGLNNTLKTQNLYRKFQTLQSKLVRLHDLENLKEMIQNGQMNRQLMMFVQSNPDIVSQVSNLPSTESLDILPCKSTDERSIAAIEGIDAALATRPTLIQDWLGDAADHVGSFLETANYHIDGMMDVLNNDRAALDSSALDDASANMVQLNNVSLESRNESVEILSRVLSLLSPIDISQLSDPSARSEITNTFMTICEEMRPFCGIDHEEGVVNPPDVDFVETRHLNQNTSLSELGYTPEATIGLIDRTVELASSLKQIVDQQGEYVASMLEAKENYSTVLSGEDTGCSQEDYRCLVTGYVHIFCCALDNAVSAILGVIAAADSVKNSSVSSEDETQPDYTSDDSV